MAEQEQRALFREWCLAFFVLLFIVGVFFSSFKFSLMESYDLVSDCKRGEERKRIQVLVVGAVERPGTYEVEAGSSVQSVLELAGLKKSADKRVLYRKKALISSCEIKVPEKVKKKKEKKIVSAKIPPAGLLKTEI